MKKAIKPLLIFLAVFVGLFLLLHGHKYHIKTEFGDSFTVSDDRLLEDIFLVSDDNSKFLHLYIILKTRMILSVYEIQNISGAIK